MSAPLGFTAPLRFKFAVNTAGKDKNWNFELLTTRYKDVEGTIEDVKREVGKGHALCAGLLGGKRKSKANVIGSQWLLLDIDNSSVQKDETGQPIKGEDGKPIKVYDRQLTLEDALAHPFIQKHCGLIYTTASHRPDWHKFRLVFLLPEYVEGSDTVEACTRFLMQHLPHDPACKDSSRVFFGSSQAEFPLVQPNATLPLDWVRQARETAQKERVEHAAQVKRFEERRRELKERADAEDWDTDALIQQALSYIPPRSPGSGNYQECLQVLMALYAHYGAEAEALAESWSPSIKGTTWNISRKIRSFRGGRTNGVTIGTLFHIAKQYGFKFPATQTQQQWREPDAIAYDEYLKQEAEREQWEFEQERYLADKANQNKLQWLAAYPDRVKWTQERLKSLTAFDPIVQNTKFVELLVKDFLPKEEPQQPPIYNQDAQVSTQRTDYSLTDLPSGLYGFVTQMGGGKTTLMLKVIREFKEGNLISFRNSLLTQTCYNEQVKDIIHFLWDLEESNDRRRWISARDGWMAACVESIAKCRPKEVLILEEVEKIKNSLLVSSTCRRERRERLREFVRHLHAAKYVFCCDADLSGSTLSWLQAITGGKKINIIQNIRQRFQWQCYFFTGAKELLDNGTVKEYPNKRADFELNLLSKFARGEKLLIAADSQRWGESVERALLMVNPGAKGLRVDSITKADDATKDEVNAFLRDPNRWIEENQPDYIIYTPTCEASLDITIEDYFDAVFGCFVHVNHLSCKQMLGRLRTNAPRYIFAKTHAINDDGGSKSPLPQVVAKHMFQHNFETIREIVLAEYPEIQDDFQLLQKMSEVIDFESKQYKDPHIQALVEARAMDNYSRANLRKNLAEELQRCGHIINWVNPGDAEAKSASAPFRKEIMMEWSEAIANAEDIDIETAWEIQQSMTANLEDRHKATKAILKDRLPEFVITSNFVYKCYLDDRQWISRQEMRYLLDHPEIAKTLDRDRWASGLKFDTAWWDIRTNSLTIKALRTLKIPEIARSGKSWDKDTDWVLEFKERAIANSKLVKLALGITATEESDACYLLRRCLERAGYPVKGRQRRVGNGERVRFYEVDAAVLSENSGIYYEVYQSVGRRFAEKLNKLGASQATQLEISVRAVCDTPEVALPEVLRLIEESTPPPNMELTSDQQEVLEGNLQLLPECEDWEMFETLVECWDSDFRALVWHHLPQQEKQRIRSLAVGQQAIAS